LKNAQISQKSKKDNRIKQAQITLPSMVWPSSIKLNTTNFQAVAAASNSKDAKKAATKLKYQIKDLARGITAQMNVRAASAIACLLLLVMGAVMASWLVGQMPLVVYMWTFITAIVTILIINTGRHMVTGDEYSVPIALFVMWLGN